MQNLTTAEIQSLLDTALAHRKKAYKLNLSSLFISEVNRQIRQYQAALDERVGA